jgi:hypothetical protein
MSKKGFTATATTFAIALGLLATAGATAQEAVSVTPDGNVGIGTATPATPLHVVRNAGALANMLRLTNNGGIQFLLERTDGNDWQFSNFGASFQISIPGSPVGQFSLVSNGDLHISNNVFATSFIPSSSRSLKEDFTEVDARAILARLAELPVNEWKFKSEGDGARHIGPTAEDFQAVFGLGQEGEGLHLTDVNGVALAALQGLYAELKERDARIAELSQVQAELLNRLAALEEALPKAPPE